MANPPVLTAGIADPEVCRMAQALVADCLFSDLRVCLLHALAPPPPALLWPLAYLTPPPLPQSVALWVVLRIPSPA